IAGNLNALKKNIRFEKSDLNRLWTQERILNINEAKDNPERKEQLELHEVIKGLLYENKGPFYFIDLHTTSAESDPFITISDSLNNRKFASRFSLPVILGIEEYLEGPLLTFINEFGHISLGFEAGQHEGVESINNCIEFIWKTLVFSGCVDRDQIKDYISLTNKIKQESKSKKFYEVNYRYYLQDNDDFMMANNFKNFDHIKKGEILAINNHTEIKAPISGQIFMPLYQKQGKDGFFIINKISKVWIVLSKALRKLKLQQALSLLPGIKQDPSNKYTLIVNPKTAQFLTTEIFHLFGYRKKISKKNKLLFIRRDREIADYF
ncbi:MAG: aspartoacylase, partial [Flavobacteriaceae bacterium]|nr:aspartoacylase [Flavobacteriaceae bacterium]